MKYTLSHYSRKNVKSEILTYFLRTFELFLTRFVKFTINIENTTPASLAVAMKQR